MTVDPQRLDNAYRIALDALLRERHPDGYWVGELATSALSTAVAVSALSKVPGDFTSLIDGGLGYLATHQNPDGGWGDTDRSFSNISTSTLCRAAFAITGTEGRYPEVIQRAEGYLRQFGDTRPRLAEAIRRRYGKDRTFSVPILMTAALAGLVDWREVPPLPFELACLPQSWFAALSLPVVSYALPALIAIGQAVFHHRGSWNPFVWPIRMLSRGRSLKVLSHIQPSNGGFLEATPLTAFVTLGLASIGRAEHPVVGKAVEFLKASVRPDGSWPIDTNLSTWVTTLAVNALHDAGELESLPQCEEVLRWLLAQQYTEKHPYTGAAPGGWGWSPLPGAVPDADDTPGALLAIARLQATMGLTPHGRQGVRWLLDLQNRDGGWPTFCRGWTNLAFDRSGSDLTAHALRALSQSEVSMDFGPLRPAVFHRLGPAYFHGFAFLAKNQRPDGSWLPLWFGNQHAPDDENPTYGTAKVLAAYRDLGKMDSEPAKKGVAWLVANQNADGGWGAGRGTPSSVEETGLALDALLGVTPPPDAVNTGLEWLVQQVESGGLATPTPIGFYFAKLWYYERLYPILFSVAALGRARRTRQDRPANGPS
jgi:squalene-hopene/tetraprenyl-beta-curcumene cyclase